MVTSVLTIPLVIFAMHVPAAPGRDWTESSILDNSMTLMHTQQHQQPPQPGGALRDDL